MWFFVVPGSGVSVAVGRTLHASPERFGAARVGRMHKALVSGDYRNFHKQLRNLTAEVEVEAEVRAPFEGVSEQAFFQRLSWSPDGESLCATNAQKSNRPVAAMLSRGVWTSTADLVGHKQPVVAARFCPNLFRPDGDGCPWPPRWSPSSPIGTFEPPTNLSTSGCTSCVNTSRADACAS